MTIDLILPAVAGVTLVMIALWVRQTRTRDATAVDVAWAGCLGALAVYFALAADGLASRRVLVGLLGGIWGFRLAFYLFRNRVLGHEEEDGRYRDLRAGWGRRAQPYFLVFYLAQGFLALLLSAPFLLAATNPAPSWSPLEIGAAALWVAAIAGEAVADHQLARFRADATNRGKTCRSGLWRYSRHPNYFFEWLIWCSFALVALPASGGWVALACPGLMLFLIVKVTGIPPAEEQALRSRGEDYRRYQRTTSPFVPWFPRKETS